MNISNLKSIYPSLVIYKSNLTTNKEDFEWFETKDKEIIGISKLELQGKEGQLLSSFLTKIHLIQQSLSKREKAWKYMLLHNQLEKLELHSFRFILFQTEKAIGDHELFDQAIQAIFPRRMPILWLSPSDGVIIEEIHTDNQQPAEFAGIVDIIMSDLYMKVRFFIGEFMEDLVEASNQFGWLQKFANAIFPFTKKSVLNVSDALSTYLVHQLDAEVKGRLTSHLLKSTIEDTELIRTIRVFLESNSNITKAAQKMYMHRNSLQYRIDKFIEITGIDIKTFQGSMTAYLLLMMLDEKKAKQ